MNFKVCVVGLGHAGLPLVSVLTDVGLETYGFDIDSKTVEKLNSGINPIPQEPGVDEILRKHLNKNLFFTNNLSSLKDKVNAYIIIVPLFISKNKVPDFSILDSAFFSVGKNLKKSDLVVLETTVPPKTTETRFKNLLEKESNLKAGVDFYLGYSPERIMTGDSINRLKNMPKVISGLNDTSLGRVERLYSKFNSKLYCAKTMREAELTKVLEGVFRDTNLAIANEAYKICDMYDVDYHHLRLGANQNPYCNLLIPGIGVSGHCIPVYPWFVIQDGLKRDIYFDLTLNARKVNDSMVDYFVDKVKNESVKQDIKKIGIVGLAYREGVNSLAYARSIPLVKKLKNLGFEIFGFDNNLSQKLVSKELGINLMSPNELKKCDLILIVNKIKEYLPELKSLKDIVIIDPKGLLNR